MENVGTLGLEQDFFLLFGEELKKTQNNSFSFSWLL